MKNWIIGFLALTVIDVSIVDSTGDRSKSLVLVTYSNGVEDTLVVDKRKFDDANNEDVIVAAAIKMANKRLGKTN